MADRKRAAGVKGDVEEEKTVADASRKKRAVDNVEQSNETSSTSSKSALISSPRQVQKCLTRDSIRGLLCGLLLGDALEINSMVRDDFCLMLLF